MTLILSVMVVILALATSELFRRYYLTRQDLYRYAALATAFMQVQVMKERDRPSRRETVLAQLKRQ